MRERERERERVRVILRVTPLSHAASCEYLVLLTGLEEVQKREREREREIDRERERESLSQ